MTTTDDQGWTETDLKPYLDQLDRYAKELAALTATTGGDDETPKASRRNLGEMT